MDNKDVSNRSSTNGRRVTFNIPNIQPTDTSRALGNSLGFGNRNAGPTNNPGVNFFNDSCTSQMMPK